MGESRVVESPLTAEMLAVLPTDCPSVVIHGPLTDDEYQRVAALLEEYPDKNMHAIQLQPSYGGKEPATPITDLEFLRHFPKRVSFTCSLEYLQSLDGIEHLQSARKIVKFKTPRRMSAAPLATLTNLEHLTLDGHFTGRDALRQLTGLTDFSMGYAGKVNELTFLPPNITRFSMNLGSITDISDLITHPTLERVDFHKVQSLADLTPLSQMTRIRELYLGKLYKVTELFDMSALTELTELTVYSLIHLTDLRPVLTAPNLRTLSVYDLPALEPGSWHDTCTGWLAQGKPPFWE